MNIISWGEKCSGVTTSWGGSHFLPILFTLPPSLLGGSTQRGDLWAQSCPPGWKVGLRVPYQIGALEKKWATPGLVNAPLPLSPSIWVMETNGRPLKMTCDREQLRRRNLQNKACGMGVWLLLFPNSENAIQQIYFFRVGYPNWMPSCNPTTSIILSIPTYHPSAGLISAYIVVCPWWLNLIDWEGWMNVCSCYPPWHCNHNIIFFRIETSISP